MSRTERVLEPKLSDEPFFDRFFREMNVQVGRMHREMQAMRNAMLRLQPADPDPSVGPSGGHHLDRFRDPIVTGHDGCRRLEVQLDVSTFRPEEIGVKTVENQLTIHAKHEQKTANSSVYHVLSRQYTLPEGIDPEHLRASLSNDGVLSIACALDEGGASRDTEIAIHQS